MINFGAGGIRTPGTLSGHNSLAGSPIRPLSHRSKEERTRSFYYIIHSRSRGDSNPRYLTAQRFSRPPPSTTRTPLQSGFLAYRKDGVMSRGVFGGMANSINHLCTLNHTITSFHRSIKKPSDFLSAFVTGVSVFPSNATSKVLA